MVGYGLMPRWSPDKTADRIAFQRARQRGGRWFSLWTLDLIEGEGRRLTEVAASANAALVVPVLEPGRPAAGVLNDRRAGRDGRGGAGRAGAGRGRAGAGRGRSRQRRRPAWAGRTCGRSTPTASNRQRLTDGNGTNLSPWWAADNRVYFISDRGGNECVWSARADAAKPPGVAGVAGPAVPEAGGGRAATKDKDAAAATDPREAEH